MRSIHGTGTSQDGVWAKLAEDTSLGIPAAPFGLTLPPVRTPDPPLLNPAHTVPERALACALAYKGAVECRYRPVKLRNLIPARGIAQSKHYAAFANGALLLTAAKIAPAAWCMFSVDAWRTPGAAGRPHTSLPPPSIVFSKVRIAERREWFADEAMHYSRGMVHLTDEHRDVLQRWSAAQSALVGAAFNGAPTAELRALVAEHFTGWQARVDAAHASNARSQAELQAALGRGLWLWR